MGLGHGSPTVPHLPAGFRANLPAPSDLYSRSSPGRPGDQQVLAAVVVEVGHGQLHALEPVPDPLPGAERTAGGVRVEVHGAVRRRSHHPG